MSSVSVSEAQSTAEAHLRHNRPLRHVPHRHGVNGMLEVYVRRAFLCRTFAAVAVAALTLPAYTTQAARVKAAAPLAQLSIHLTDLRPGYVVGSQNYRTASTLASSEPLVERQLLAHGWLGGYDARYQQAQNSNVQIGQFADRFGSVVGAHWWYLGSLLRVPAGYQAISMPAVGDESTAIQNQAFVGIIFRQGTVVMDIYVSLQVPSPSTSVLSLARLVDRRIMLNGTGPSATPPPTARPTGTPSKHRGKHKTVRPAKRAFFLQIWIKQQTTVGVAHLTLYAHTVPGATCTATVTDTHPLQHLVFSGYPRVALSNGLVDWRWYETMKGIGGTATATCTYHGRSKTKIKIYAAHV